MSELPFPKVSRTLTCALWLQLQSYKTQEQYQQMPAMKKMEELAEFLGTLEPDGPELRGAFLSQPTSDADLHYSNVTNEHDGLMISENLSKQAACSLLGYVPGPCLDADIGICLLVSSPPHRSV